MPKTQEQSDMDNPAEHFAWAFAAGVPDPRGEQYGFHPLIPAPAFAGFSRMLWDMGFRHQPELQTKWVNDYAGPDRNLIALGLIDQEPSRLIGTATEMLVDQFPEIAEKLAQVNTENRDEMVREQAAALRDSLARLKEAEALVEKKRKERGSS